MADELTDAIVGMREDAALSLVSDMLERGHDPARVLEQAKEAMAVLGERFEHGEAFVSELIMGGEIMKAVSAVVGPHLQRIDDGGRGRVVIGTVRGDIHDIGKDIVVMMLDVGGYEVHDLGVDVPVERFVAAVEDRRPDVVGLSGLLTLTFKAMKDTVEAIATAGLRDTVKIMVGGGPVDEQVRVYTGADGWGNDVGRALDLAARWTREGG